MRNLFKDSVFKRDSYKCICCGDDAVDAHHIIERRLFPCGGYYIDNGVSLCAQHHISAERTDISTAELRKLANINTIILPPNYNPLFSYDKWGNVYKNGIYYRGELYHSEQMQKVLSDKIHLFSNYYVPIISTNFTVYKDKVLDNNLNIIDEKYEFQSILDDIRVEFTGDMVSRIIENHIVIDGDEYETLIEIIGSGV